MNKKEKLIELMSKNLDEDEIILNCVHGAFESKINEKSNVKTGILALTSKKIRFCGKRLFLIYDDVIEYEEIIDVSSKEEKLGYNIFIKGKNRPYFMKYVVDENIHKFVNDLKEMINK